MRATAPIVGSLPKTEGKIQVIEISDFSFSESNFFFTFSVENKVEKKIFETEVFYYYYYYYYQFYLFIFILLVETEA